MRHRSFTSDFIGNYRAPWWLPGGNAQTIWPAVFARRTRGPVPEYRRERWTTPDGDFVDLDFLDTDVSPRRPLVVLFHGLEGSSRSHYSEAFADVAWRGKLTFVVPHFRGCSGEMNLAPRAYHSGDHAEIDFILRRLRQRHQGPIVALGVSLGGNALLRWAGEMEEDAGGVVSAVAAVCSPLDLAAGGHAIGHGFNRMVYTTMFLRTMKPKALHKWSQHPGLQQRIRIPALAMNSCNDPFIPVSSLPRPEEVAASVTLWQPAQGGHVGFPAGPFPGHVLAMPEAVSAWLLQASGITTSVPAEWPERPMTVPAAL